MAQGTPRRSARAAPARANNSQQVLIPRERLLVVSRGLMAAAGALEPAAAAAKAEEAPSHTVRAYFPPHVQASRPRREDVPYAKEIKRMQSPDLTAGEASQFVATLPGLVLRFLAANEKAPQEALRRVAEVAGHLHPVALCLAANRAADSATLGHVIARHYDGTASDDELRDLTISFSGRPLSSENIDEMMKDQRSLAQLSWRTDLSEGQMKNIAKNAGGRYGVWDGLLKNARTPTGILRNLLLKLFTSNEISDKHKSSLLSRALDNRSLPRDLITSVSQWARDPEVVKKANKLLKEDAKRLPPRKSAEDYASWRGLSHVPDREVARGDPLPAPAKATRLLPWPRRSDQGD